MQRKRASAIAGALVFFIGLSDVAGDCGAAFTDGCPDSSAAFV